MDRQIKPNFVPFITEYEHSIITPGFPRALDRNHLQSKDRSSPDFMDYHRNNRLFLTKLTDKFSMDGCVVIIDFFELPINLFRNIISKLTQDLLFVLKY